MNIILCGLPGSGKTTVGEILTEKLNGTFIDIDEVIEHEYAKRNGEILSCRQIYNQKGALFFRKLESLIISSLASKPFKNVVISLGGGALETDEHIQMLKNLGTLVYLKLDLKELFQRIIRNGLPAYLDPKDPFASFEILAQKRMALFEEAADMHVDADQLTPDAIADKILKKIPKKHEITLYSEPIHYPIFVREGLLQSEVLVKHLKALKASNYVIITDETIEKLHAKKLEDFLKNQGLPVSLFSFPSGEEFKSREIKESCENYLLSLGAGRDTCIIGMGGGVVTDIAGFVASTYCRGVPIVSISTSLLGMVDASIGGKTAVNVPEGKNMIGTFSQPHSVFIDTSILKTLPLAEIKNGMAEMIKHGLIADKEYFLFLQTHAKKLLEIDLPIIEKAIFDSITIKAQIVEEDSTEQGKRRLLNFGHTVAHAIEIATKYEIPHGRAVAIGIITESYMSMQMGHLQKSDFKLIRDIFDDFQIDLTWNKEIQPNDLLEIMKWDKKSLGKIPRFIILEQIGKPLDYKGEYCTRVDDNLLKTSIEWMCSRVMQRH